MVNNRRDDMGGYDDAIEELRKKIERIEQLDIVDEVQEKEDENEDIEFEKADSNFDLKKWGAEVWSNMPELNKDFTMANLSDQMFNSRVVNFIRNRILLIKLLRNVFKYAERDIENVENLDTGQRMRVVHETVAFRKCKALILSDVYTILNLSKGRGGLVLKAFLEGDMGKEQMEIIAGADGPAIGEPLPKRTFKDKILGRNKTVKRTIGSGSDARGVSAYG